MHVCYVRLLLTKNQPLKKTMHDRSKKYTGWKILMDTHRKKYMQQARRDVETDTKNRYQKESWEVIRCRLNIRLS